ncbi:MAG: DHHA1 domain-containing protein [Infirmifilum sp.]
MMLTIIAHGDIDGMVSAAIIISYYLKNKEGVKYKVYFSQPFSLHNTLQRIHFTSGEVYILDIAFNEEYWETTSQALSLLTRVAQTTWIDHHPSTIFHKDKITATGVNVLAKPAPSTASLLANLIPLTIDPDFSLRLIKLAELTDTPNPDPSVRELGLESAAEILTGAIALEPRDDDLRKKIIESWVKKRILVPEEAVLRFQESEEKLQRLLKEVKNRVIYDSSVLRIIDLRDLRVYGFSGRIASQEAAAQRKIILILFRIGQNSVVITGRAPTGFPVNLAQLFSRFSEELGVSGGGHNYAASLRVPAGIADKVVRQIINEVEKAQEVLNQG